MTNVKTTTRATRASAPSTLARATVATLLALAAPAVSFLPALTSDIHGSGAAVRFPHGYAVMLIVTVVVTAIACALGALIAGRSGVVAISLGLGVWLVIGLAVTIAGASLGHHAHLTQWGIALIAAVLAGRPRASLSPRGADTDPLGLLFPQARTAYADADVGGPDSWGVICLTCRPR